MRTQGILCWVMDESDHDFDDRGSPALGRDRRQAGIGPKQIPDAVKESSSKKGRPLRVFNLSIVPFLMSSFLSIWLGP